MNSQMTKMAKLLLVLCALGSIAAKDSKISLFPTHSKKPRFELSLRGKVFNRYGNQISSVAFRKEVEDIEVPFGETGEITLEGKGYYISGIFLGTVSEMSFEVSWPYWFDTQGHIQLGTPGIPSVHHSRGFHNHRFKEVDNLISPTGRYKLVFSPVSQESSVYELIDIADGQSTENPSISIGPISAPLMNADNLGFRKTGIAPGLHVVVKRYDLPPKR